MNSVEDRVHAALHDALTGLPNRTLLLNRLAEQLGGGGRQGAAGRARTPGPRVALVLLDLDRFTLVNETLGDAAGEAVGRREWRCESAGARSRGAWV